MPSPLLAQRTTFVNNLLNLHTTASSAAYAEGLAWYPKARAIMHDWALHYGVHHTVCACVTAALSPQVSWERNLIMADDVLAERPLSLLGIQKNMEKAIALRREPEVIEKLGVLHTMQSLFPTGRKVQSFACNLSGDTDTVTVDTHGFQAAFNDSTLVRTFHSAAYHVIAAAYRIAAWKSGHRAPCDFQAIIWCSWKERYPRAQKLLLRRKW